MALIPLPTLASLTADTELAAAFEVLGRKWNGLILHTLATRPARFGELHAAIGSISTKVLSDRLRELVDAGLVTHAQLPPGPAVAPGSSNAIRPPCPPSRIDHNTHEGTTHRRPHVTGRPPTGAQ
jgi:hypothetical protein